jgi:hypothetical protein
MELKEFKISCHAIGEIMAGEVGLTPIQDARLIELELRANGEGKPLTDNMKVELSNLIEKRDNPELPKGAKSYCKKWLKKSLFGYSENWKSIVIDKGLAVEEDGINLVSEIYETKLYKNEDWFENEFCKGTPDIIDSETVRDIKCSWDIFTFPMFDDELPKKEYWWQLQGYMWLLGIKKASLDYVLIDTPMPLVLMDLKKLYFQSGGVAEDWTPEKYELMYPNYRFDSIPKKMRVKSFVFEYQSWVEEHISFRVELCRKYIKELINNK